VIRALARFSVMNSVAVNLATLTVIAAGVLAYLAMPREVFPDFSLGTVTVRTLYPGSTPEDVERLVTLPLEEKCEGLDGKREMSSVSQEGYSLLTLTIQRGTDMSRFLDDVRAAVSSGDLELPEASEDPVITEIKTEFPAIGFFVYGQAGEDQLRVLAERHQRALEKIPGVARVIMQGHREPRIWVEVDPVSLERYGLTLADVGRAVGRRSSDVPLGSLTTTSGDYLLRVEADVMQARDLLDLFVQHRPDGSGVRLSEVARVVDTYERLSTRARFNGQPSIYLRVNKEAGGDAIDICRDVYEYIDAERAGLPAGVALGTNGDLSIYVRNRLRVMRDSAFLGGLLVLVSLILFLNLRVALITALGIPVAFLGGLVMAHALGISMNMLTMFALIVVLGMIVDDAIVVGENVYRLMEEGLSPIKAAIQGTVEVGKPVLATILTTIAAFLPTLMIGGMMGKFMRPLPIIVTFCLIASLCEALLVLPAHLAHWVGHVRAPGEEGKALRRWYDPLRDAYLRLLVVCVRWRYVSLTATFTGIMLLVGLAVYRVPFVLFDNFESKVFSINVRAKPGTPLEETDRIVTAIERMVFELPTNELESTNTVAGVSYDDASRFSVAHNLGQVWVELREDTVGRRPTSDIIESLREDLAVLPPLVESIDIVQPQAGPTGKAIDVSIRGADLVVLEDIAERIKADVQAFRGTRDVFDNSEPGKREVRVRLTDAGRLLGFDEASLAGELRASFEGTRFARVRRGKDDVEIVVKLPEELRQARGEIERLPVGGVGPSLNGRSTPVPLGMVAELYETDGPAVISRDDGERSVRVYADVNATEGNSTEITSAIMEKYAEPGALPPGYSVEFKGEQQDTAESFAGLKLSLLIALFMIYMILGTLFRSVAQPIVIMSAIPFGAVGMILGHLLMGRVLSFMSLIGFVALTGIVVNDSLILIDFVNQRRREGLPLHEALLVAGRQRFRPILLTSITTMLGLSPLTFFASGQARFLQPMAITIFFGLACSTALILFVVPCAYGVLEDLRAFVRHPRGTLRALARGREVEHLPLPHSLQDLGV
jgi:multidrug efflux pump subunit AcrB